jgi:hypothetical protein
LAAAGAASVGVAVGLIPTRSASTNVVHIFACDADTCRQVDGRHSGAAGRFTSGEIDLTGDGIPEVVQLEDAALVVLESGDVVWRSEPGWVVVDAALGDPNQDGRYEALLAFWRNDATGVPRSQPFIIGYRWGLWRTLWGGSPVTDPILELALGDVDGDRAEDLVVIEATNAGPQRMEDIGAYVGIADRPSTVAVWRWHGWGFSRIWRSPVGVYRDLVLLPGKDGAPATIAVIGLPE